MSNTALVHAGEHSQIGGYDYGHANVAQSPVTLEELHRLEQTVGWSEEDARILQRHGEIFRENAEKMVDVAGGDWFSAPLGQVVLWTRRKARCGICREGEK